MNGWFKTLKVIAKHEAAHAVIARSFGIRLNYVWIAHKAGLSKAVEHPNADAGGAVQYLNEQPPYIIPRMDAAVSMAGPVADIFGEKGISTSDQQVSALIKRRWLRNPKGVHTSGYGVDFRHVAEHGFDYGLASEVAPMVRNHWNEITALADQLYANGLVDFTAKEAA